MVSNSSAVLSLFLLLQLLALLTLTLGGLYALFCLGRAATGIDRLASVAEAWLVWQQTQAATSVSATPVTIETTRPSATFDAPTGGEVTPQ